MVGIFGSVLGMTLTGGVLTLLALAALPVTKRLLPPKWHCRLLSAILLFFLLPVGAVAATLLEKIISAALFVRESDFAALWDDIPAPLAMTMNPQAQTTPEAATLLETVLPFLPAVWIVGMLASLIFKASQLIRFERLLAKSNVQITDNETLDAFHRIKKELKISDSVSLWQNPCISTPMLMGLTRTRLILPQIDFSGDELELILRHELTHHRNRDLWVKLATVPACAIHWFNPCIYLLSSGLDRFLEMACDADVVREMDREQRRIYGATILTVLGRASCKQPGIYAAFSSNKKEMKGRLSAMLNGKKQSKKVMVFSILVLAFVCIVGVGVSAAANKEADKIKSIRVIEGDGYFVSVEEPDKLGTADAGYTIAGDDFFVRVTKEQFDAFGTDEFPLDDLEGFIKLHNLEKIYPDKNGVIPTLTFPDDPATYIPYYADEDDVLPPLSYDEREREAAAYTPYEGASDARLSEYTQIEQQESDDAVAYYTPAPSDSESPQAEDESELPNPLDFMEGTQPEFSSFLWPTISDGYISAGLNGYPGHTGMDIVVPLDTPVYASAPGIVVKAVESNVGYGKYIVIDHGGGYQTLYAHCNSLTASVGDTVEAGQVIAAVGRTGRTTGFNLHFELRKNHETLNPEDYVNMHNEPMEWPHP